MPEFQFESLADFFGMGGYASYVWASYAFFAVVMSVNLVLPLLDKRKVMNLLKARMQRDAVRAQSAGAGE